VVYAIITMINLCFMTHKAMEWHGV